MRRTDHTEPFPVNFTCGHCGFDGVLDSDMQWAFLRHFTGQCRDTKTLKEALRDQPVAR